MPIYRHRLASLICIVIVFGSGCGIDSWKEFEKKGIEYGRGKNQNECMSEALLRAEKTYSVDYAGNLKLRWFLGGCLESSSEVPGFCDDVPGKYSLSVSEWKKEKCASLSGVIACRGVYDVQHSFCRF